MPVYVRNSGEIYQVGERLPECDRWMQHLAYIMDGAVRIGPWSIGLDPLIGLVPGFGDLLGALISMLIVGRAVQAGIPRIAIARMVTNIAIDTLVGSIPLFGDAFDFAYKANLKNLRIYEQSLYARRGRTARHWGFFLALFLGLGALGAAVVFGMIALIRAVAG
jgi:hypothetical protein